MKSTATAVAAVPSRQSKLTGGFRTFWRILSYAKPYRPLMIFGVLLLGVDIFFSIAIAWVQQIFIDVINSGDVARLMYIVKVCSFVSLGVLIAVFVGNYARNYAMALMNRDMSVAVFRHINRLPYSYVQRTHSADLVSRVTSDVNQASGTVGSSIYGLVFNVLQCIAAFFYLSRIDLPLAILVVVSGPVTFGVGRFFDRKIRVLSKSIQDKGAELRSILQETLQGMAVIKAFGLESRFHDRYFAERVVAKDMMKRRTLLSALMNQTTGLVNWVTMMGSITFIALAAVRGSLSVGSALAFVLLIGRVQWPFVGLSHTWGSIQQGLGAADRVFAVLDEKPEDYGQRGEYVSSEIDQMLAVDGSEYAVRLKGVSFAYSRRDDADQGLSGRPRQDRPPNGQSSSGQASNAQAPDTVDQSAERSVLFDALDLDVKPGEIVALVGPSGSGKTTLAQLVCGLHKVDKGDIEIFGRSIASDTNGARALLAYVPQSPYLFAGTIKENIAYGKENATDVEIVEAARAANADEFIEALEGGYDAKIGEHGASLSGGQRQRIAIARAFLRKSPLIVLDEATSSLDNESEHLVQESMDRLMRGRTALVIAHRLSTVRNATRIVVLEKGRIVEQGTHDELMREGGLYSRLYRIQFEGKAS